MGQYDYDDSGLRIRHRYSERGDVDYFHDGRSIIEERRAGDGSVLARYSYADKLLSLTTPAGSQYYHHDALGSTVNLTDSSGATKVSYFINPWGLILKQIGASENRQVFTGKEIDERTGLVYFGARYYDPDTGRFINQDDYLGDEEEPPSLHRYLYAYSNPLVYVDEDGNESIREMWRLNDKAVEEDAAKDKSWKAAAKYAAKSTGYKIWNGLTGGFLERQDNRQEKLDRGQISESDFWKGTGIDATVSVGTQVAGGVLLGKAASGGGLIKTMATGAAVSGGSSLVEQSAQVLTYEATDGRLGQERIDVKQVVESAGSGALVAGGLYGAGKAISGVASWRATQVSKAATAELVEAETNALQRIGANHRAKSVSDRAQLSNRAYSRLAINATTDDNFSKVVLGKYIVNSVRSYEYVAKQSYSTYFHLRNWNRIEKQIGKNRMWNINKKFLDQQWRANKEFYLSHNPWDSTGYYQDELLHLIDLGAKDFEQVGKQLWKVVK